MAHAKSATCTPHETARLRQHDKYQRYLRTPGRKAIIFTFVWFSSNSGYSSSIRLRHDIFELTTPPRPPFRPNTSSLSEKHRFLVLIVTKINKDTFHNVVTKKTETTTETISQGRADNVHKTTTFGFTIFKDTQVTPPQHTKNPKSQRTHMVHTSRVTQVNRPLASPARNTPHPKRNLRRGWGIRSQLSKHTLSCGLLTPTPPRQCAPRAHATNALHYFTRQTPSDTQRELT